MISKTKTETGYSYTTSHQTRNDKRDFKYALVRVVNGKNLIEKLANDVNQLVSHANRFWFSHAIAVDIETKRILWEKKR